MNETLDRIADIIDRYESLEWHSLERLQEISRELVIYNYHLSKFNIEAGVKHNAIMFNRNGKSVASAKVEADEVVPELRHSRKIMEAVDQVIWSIRSEISIIKKES